MRTRKSLRNIAVTFGLQGLSILVSFFARQYFIARLGTSYLGLNGIFENVLSMLSLAELGFSTAFMFALFKPIAEDDRARIVALMGMFRKVYGIIGAIIFGAGLAVIPLLHLFIKTDIDFSSVILYYVLYLSAVSVTYLFSYKKTLLIANQDKYITSIVTYSAFCLLNGAQVLLLRLTGSYALFLGALIVTNLSEGIIVNAVSNRRYAYLKEIPAGIVPKEDRAFIKRNVRALFIHRIGGVVIDGTDNIVISAYVGLTQVGIYSNYLLALNAVSIVLGQIFSALTASVGNLGVTDNKKRYYEVYNVGLYVNALLFMSLASVLWFVVDDFVVWLGSPALLDRTALAVVLVNFLINGMRRITASYREAQALYWYDRYKPIAESIVNLGVSVWLAQTIGIAGVFIGTLVSLLLTSFWVEPYILFKYGFGLKLREYFKKYALYLLVGGLSFAAVLGLRSLWRFEPTLLAFIAESALYMLAAVAVFLLCTWRTAECRELRGILSAYARRLRRKPEGRNG